MSSTSCNISFYEPNGTYIYSITTSNRIYRYSANLGFFTVKGRSVSESVRFSRITYSITFIESGLPSGSTWYVDITGNNGTVYDSGAITGSSYSFSLTNGTYSYTVGNISGYNTSKPSGSLTVNGKNTFQSITFSSVPSTTTQPKKPSPSSNTDLYIIVGAVAAVAVVGAVITIVMRKRK